MTDARFNVGTPGSSTNFADIFEPRENATQRPGSICYNRNSTDFNVLFLDTNALYTIPLVRREVSDTHFFMLGTDLADLYCKKGYAPCSDLITSVTTPGSYTLSVVLSSRSVYKNDGLSGTTLITPFWVNIYMVGGGMGGSMGPTGNYGGGGGGGGGKVLGKCLVEGASITVGDHGHGATGTGFFGGNGGDTFLQYGATVVARAGGGYAPSGSVIQGGYGGAASALVIYPLLFIPGEDFIGGDGGNGGQTGDHDGHAGSSAGTVTMQVPSGSPIAPVSGAGGTGGIYDLNQIYTGGGGGPGAGGGGGAAAAWLWSNPGNYRGGGGGGGFTSGDAGASMFWAGDGGRGGFSLYY